MPDTSRTDRGVAPAGRVVVALVDGTPDGERALAYPALLARRLGGRLDLVHVGPAETPGARLRAAHAGRAYVAGAAERLRDAVGPPARGAHPVLLHGAPAAKLARHAEVVAADVVVLPVGGRGAVTRAALGRVALSVLRGAPCPVLVVPPHASPAPRADWPRHVVVATGGDAHADEALAPLADLAVPGADGLVLTVDEPVAVSTSRLAGAGAAGGGGGAFGVAAVVARLRAAGRALAVDHVSGARPARAVANAAAVRGADLVAVATHGDRGVERAFGGSVAEEVVARATCPVWVAHLCC